ncbi:sodium:solute symporter family protein [Caldinitratiruptor microaerophilus]|uniref:Sodium:solute symporter n=1 Tax=Caldinitratiruptor microaerophilus TaxID=671077 RepID=A0AA35G899_9FIRM|nr:sodium:solute symporter family protein [Caldinitratiruptor microaerophilus]BDG59059.1 sodium:solute symporter [Caldinitratiruptor microaerophilus]
MTPHGRWILGLAVLYTAVLIVMGQVARRRAQRGEDFFVAGRRFSPILVAVCITGLFSGSTFISVLELSYLTGVSAVWYGVAETVQVLLIALFLVGPFRERAIVTVSGLIGDQYGRAARALAGAITAFAFPMWSVATALAFASAVHVFTGIPLLGSLVITALLLLAYLQGGGMWSIALTQSANAIVFALMLAIGLAGVLLRPGLGGLATLSAARPELLRLDTVGMQTIVAWFGTFIVNVPLAQAAFQMALSCRTAAEGRRGLYLASLMGIPFILVGVLLGLAAALAVPGIPRGLVAVPQYLASVLPAPLTGLFFLGIWACALGWGAPCQFSGATSLGRDVGMALRPQAREADLVRYTRWSLVLLTVLMVLFGVLRSEQAAWWNVLAWTVRNSATFAPVITALLWRGATVPGVLAAMGAGFLAGTGWYQLSGWSVNRFFLDIHPVWVGMGTNLAVLVLVSLLTRRDGWQVAPAGRGAAVAGYSALGSGVLLLAVAAGMFAALRPTGLLGLVLFLGVLGLCLGTMWLVRPRPEVAGRDLAAVPSRLAGTG